MSFYGNPIARPVLVLGLVVLGALACGGLVTGPSNGTNPLPSATNAARSSPPPTTMVLVGPKPVACALGECIQVYDPASGAYHVDLQGIPGFDYIPGYVWQLQVEEIVEAAPGSWQLSRIISQERAAGEITIRAPQVGDAFPSGGVLRGSVQVMPSDGQLVYRVFDAAGALLGSAPIGIISGEGTAGTFEASIRWNDYGGPGRIEVFDLYGPVGFVGHATAVDVYLGMASPPESRPTPLVLEARAMSIDSPASYAIVAPTFEVRGQVTISPFESTLGYHVLGGDGNLLAAGSIQVQAEMGQPGAFTGSISLPDSYRGPARLILFEGSAADGLILMSATLDVFVDSASGP